MKERIFDLPCFGTRKSFYGKAKCIETTCGEKILLSYDTKVCKITANNEFVMLWDGKSQTTTRHIKSFRIFYNV